MRFPKIEHFRQQSLSRHFTKKKKTGRTWTSWTFYFGQNGRVSQLGWAKCWTPHAGQDNAMLAPPPKKPSRTQGSSPRSNTHCSKSTTVPSWGRMRGLCFDGAPLAAEGQCLMSNCSGGNMSSGTHWSVPACLAVKLMGVCTSLQPEKGDSATLCKATAAIGGPLLLTAIQRVGPLPTGTRCASGCGGKPPLGGR